jgi:hypothetical protein
MSKIAVTNSNWSRHAWALAWVLDDGELGGEIGEIHPSKLIDDDEDVLKLAYEAAKPFADGHRPRHGFIFHTESRAKKAAAAVRAAFKADAAKQAGKPLPEWAQKASAEGWKPPRGWKP